MRGKGDSRGVKRLRPTPGLAQQGFPGQPLGKANPPLVPKQRNRHERFAIHRERSFRRRGRYRTRRHAHTRRRFHNRRGGQQCPPCTATALPALPTQPPRLSRRVPSSHEFRPSGGVSQRHSVASPDGLIWVTTANAPAGVPCRTPPERSAQRHRHHAGLKRTEVWPRRTRIRNPAKCLA